MAQEKSFTETTSADDKSIGFDYQYYYFLHRILNLGVGQSVGLEILDDVHTELDASFIVLFQLKHTVRTSASGLPVALTELDADLWKTLYNWAKIIGDDAEKRAMVPAQLKFVDKTEFHLVSNKSHSKRNHFLGALIDFQGGTTEFSTIRDRILTLQGETTDAEIQKYIAAVADLDDSVLQKYLSNIRFDLGLDDIIGLVKRSIKETFIDDGKIDSTFARLDSNIREDNFIAIKKGEKIVVTFEDFRKRYWKIFDDARSKTLVQYPFKPELPDDVLDQRFIRRLMDVSALSPSDIESAVKYTTLKLQISKYLEQWVQEGTLVSADVSELHSDVITQWENEFIDAFEGYDTEEDIKTVAKGILRMLRRVCFRLAESSLNVRLSNGELYYLSDMGRIGWHRDWEQHD
ncbi:hypothetical protein NK8_05030 [Caballeronia sp. NK8]|uniref:ABC-three component system protein n=1 Tax=Caballeronia sp. NK8 TaxID=140098 RepID=UPI001BB4F949|nr:ABC-three component system protein [Caballeronia sp. NK8]BCQ22394.1 hypothetical protein NK8_05030 [Caballeronia sp. NK8]